MVGPKTPRWLNQFQLVLGDLAIGRPIIRKPLNQFRQELGLPPVKGRVLPDWWFRVDVTLGLFPDWFAEPQPDWPQPFAATGFPLWAGGTCAPLSEPLKRFLDDGRPPIVWTAGTANRHAAKFFATAIEACQRLNERGVLLTKYPEQLPGKLPPSIRHDTFVPLAKLLPRAAAFVHHGGIGLDRPRSGGRSAATGCYARLRPARQCRPTDGTGRRRDHPGHAFQHQSGDRSAQACLAQRSPRASPRTGPPLQRPRITRRGL